MKMGQYRWNDDPLTYVNRRRGENWHHEKIDDRKRNQRMLKEYFSAGGKVKRYDTGGRLIDKVKYSGKLFP